MIFVIFLVLGAEISEAGGRQTLGNTHTLAGVGKIQIFRCGTVAPKNSIFENILKNLTGHIERRIENVRFIWYHSGSAGEEDEIVQKMRAGMLDCAGLSGNGLGYIAKPFRVMNLPLLVRKREEAQALKKGMLKLFRKMVREEGFEFVGFIDVGFVYMFSRQAIRKLEDVKGKRVWTWHKNVILRTIKQSMARWEAVSVEIPVLEVYNFKDRVDIVFNSPYLFLTLGWHEFAKYMSVPPLLYSIGGFVISGRIRKFEGWEDVLVELEKILEASSHAVHKMNQRSIQIALEKGVRAVEFEDFQKLEEEIKRRWQELAGMWFPRWLLQSALEIVIKLRALE